jgi:hypothetical protein
MANIEIEPQIVLPTRPVIRYARADLLDTATIFRVFFDVFLALFSAAFGAAITEPHPLGTMHKAFLWVTGVAALTFIVLDVIWMIRARREG